jgi:DNA-directed RNA polymerase specialized sigma24 family protein
MTSPAPAATVVQSFEAFALEQSVALQKFAFLMIGNCEDARDAVQEALFGAYRKWDRIAGDPTSYVRRSIVNAGISAWRKRRREVPVAEVGEPDWRGTVPGVNTVLVEQLCSKLTGKQRAIVVMRYYQDLSFAEIAAAVGCSESGARTQLQRAIATLRATINEGRA